jgi:hypothetical protein
MSFAKQITSYKQLRRIKAIGHPASEGFEQHYDWETGLYAGYVITVNNFGIGYRSFPASLRTGRLFNTLNDALDYLLEG